jgi:hypothetical protein
MQLDKRKVENAICSKGFRIDDDHHHFFIYYTLDGRRTSIRTHTSHGSKGGINDFLIGKMSRQCRLHKQQFLDLVHCPLARETYEEILREQKAIRDAGSEITD